MLWIVNLTPQLSLSLSFCQIFETGALLCIIKDNELTLQVQYNNV